MSRTRSQRSHVFFVDDEPLFLELMQKEVTSRRGDWNLSFFDSPRKAITAAKSDSPSILVTDLQMPEMDGFALIDEIQTIVSDLVVIMLSGAAQLNDAVRALNRADIYRLYTKPIAIDQLLDGVQQAAEYRSQILHNRQAQTQQIIGSVLNTIGLAVLVVEQNCRVVYANRDATLVLSSQDGISADNQDRLRCTTPQETNELWEAVRTAALPGTSEIASEVALKISRVTPEQSWHALASPLDASESASLSQNGLVMLLLRDPDHTTPPTPENLKSVYGLTRSEANLVIAICQGLTIAGAAETNNITESTARTYLKSIFSKVGVTKQAQLIKRVLSLGLNR